MIPTLAVDPVIYVCDACPARRPVHPADHRIPMHECRGRALMNLPMIREGERADLRLIEREDYVGSDLGQVTTDAEGRVFMRCEIERQAQTDVWVYAPVAVWSGRSDTAEGRQHASNGRGELRGA